MNQKIKNTLSVVITLLVAFGIIYFGNIYFQNKKDVSVVDPSSVDQLIKEETESQEENAKKREDQKKEESTNNSGETNRADKDEKDKESAEKVQERHPEISKLSNDELIVLMENIFSMSPAESMAKYDVQYLSGVLRVVSTRMNDMTEEQKQKIVKILEKSKPPQTKKDE